MSFTTAQKKSSKLIVLFDGRCGFCGKTVMMLRRLDWCHRLEFVNFHDPDKRRKYAPSIDLKALTESMHIVLQDSSSRRGFSAFRTILGVLPATLVLWPLLFIPGIPFIGERVYAFVAAHR
jgi:predicted DCC family thiol-disulfide oxidoreductase YuxK